MGLGHGTEFFLPKLQPACERCFDRPGGSVHLFASGNGLAKTVGSTC